MKPEEYCEASKMTLELLQVLQSQIFPILQLLFLIPFLAIWTLPICGGGNSSSTSEPMDEAARQRQKDEQRMWREKGAQQNLPSGAPKPPVVTSVLADSHDPNYQTLAGLGDDLFDKKAAPPPPPKSTPSANPPQAAKPPSKGGMAATHDPNYQTLAGINNDVFTGGSKNPTPKPAKPLEKPRASRPSAAKQPAVKPPAVGGIVATNDPNYQTLAGVNDCFQEKPNQNKKNPNPRVPVNKPPKKPPAIKPPTKGGKAATFDPNYQTLAGINNDVFSKK